MIIIYDRGAGAHSCFATLITTGGRRYMGKSINGVNVVGLRVTARSQVREFSDLGIIAMPGDDSRGNATGHRVR